MNNTFYKQPVSVEAMQFNFYTLNNNNAYRDLIEFAGDHLDKSGKPVANLIVDVVDGAFGYTAKLWVAANDAWVNIEINEWILKDENGSYPCKPDTFERTYTEIPPEQLYYDDATLLQVRESLVTVIGRRISLVEATIVADDCINDLQNHGIKFREASEPETPPVERLDSEFAGDGEAGPEHDESTDYTCTCEHDKAHRYDSLKLAALSLSGTTNSTGMEVTTRARLFMHYIETGEVVARLP